MSTDYIGTDARWRIPSTELNGSNASKVMQIDSLLSQLRAKKRELMTDAPTSVQVAPDLAEGSAREWWQAGAAFVVLLVVLTIAAWMTGARGDQPVLLSGTVVHESS